VGGFAWSPLAVPYLVTAVAFTAIGIMAALVRGDGVLRLAVIGAVSNTLPWAVSSAAAACTQDPVAAANLYKLGNGPVSLLGSSLALLILGAYGQTERYRRLLIVAGVVATLSLALAWATDLNIAGVRMTPSGMLYPIAGPLMLIHAGQLVIWPVVALAIVRRTTVEQPPRMKPWHVVAIVAFAAAAASDVLLAYGIAGYYPLAWVPALGAVAVMMNLIVRGDLFRARGFDRDAGVELALIAAAAGVIAVVVAAMTARGAHPLVVSLTAAPIAVVAGAIAVQLRARRAAARADDTGDLVDRIDQVLERARDHRAIEEAVAAAWGSASIADVRLWRVEGSALRRATPSTDGDPDADASPADEAVPLDAVLRTWLTEHPTLIVRGDLPTSRLGPARPLVEDLARRCGPDVVLPLVDRDQVLGVIGGRVAESRVLRDRERIVVEQIATPAGRAVAYLALVREAEAAMLAARETEVADAVATQAGTRRRADLGDWRLAAAYRAAERVAGDVWTWDRTVDGKLAILVADVAGRGVPAALVSSALAGAFAAVVAAGRPIQPAELAELLDKTITELGKGTRQATAFIAVCDHAQGIVEWLSAGHRGGCVVHPNGAGDPELAILTGASAPLGVTGPRATGRAQLVAGDLLVVVSDGVIGLRDAKGQAWGERRFAQLLRGGALAAGDQAAPLILDAALAHAAGVSPSDDLLVIAVEPN
jgi:serine phosphatase RsbU (regulator of sigma subunit)